MGRSSMSTCENGPVAASPEAPPPSALVSFRAWLGGAPLSQPTHLALGLVLPMMLVVANAYRVAGFTIDDAYISFRYARNFAEGHGLVYNLGERVEGYTNFLWTVLLGVFATLGARPEITAKVLGVVCACASLVPVYRIARRLAPLGWSPCLATWLCASSFLQTGYAVFGLESPLFVLLVLLGTDRFLIEAHDDADVFPWSGPLFALAALTRPEAPLFLLLLYVWHPDQPFSRRSLTRLATFAVPVLAHLAFRRLYYGGFFPNTLTAKTGDMNQQLHGGLDYLRRYAMHAGPALWAGIAAIVVFVVRKRRDGLAVAAIALTFGLYVLLVGGDWMPYYRFLAPAEPFAFLLIDAVVRTVAERRERAVALAVALFMILVGFTRVGSLRQAQRDIFEKDKAFWDDAGGRTAAWLSARGNPGPVAIADIGYVGYATGFPVVDMLGLLAPEIARLPGGYTNKTGAGYADAIFARDPRYVVIISSTVDCKSPTVPSSRTLHASSELRTQFVVAEPIKLRNGGAWCIFERKSGAETRPAPR
ncbi:hypothetical protein [Polyangium fumosum]|uniref:Glycosyltransferase RgtA/B/C/D-like domain-containing protein n=1 Tax=Polyangium fumosum TaxID=889272 RepID=A0A4U1JE25_9BACT|nr:hypothetical protein [Polyangium fumosum]TKD09244.1 hypothetical protein E8A74_13305 [Polyangium fumosum]